MTRGTNLFPTQKIILSYHISKSLRMNFEVLFDAFVQGHNPLLYNKEYTF